MAAGLQAGKPAARDAFLHKMKRRAFEHRSALLMADDREAS